MKKSSVIPDVVAGFVRFPLAESVAAHLRQAIGNDPDLTHLLSERNLCAGLGVSRPVVRDALKQLEQERLIERRHGLTTLIIRDVPRTDGGNIRRPDFRETPAVP